MVERRARLLLPVNGEDIAVPSAAHLRCPKCGEVVLRITDARRLGEDAITIYRRRHGLLAAEQIRGIRQRFGLTQAAQPFGNSIANAERRRLQADIILKF